MMGAREIESGASEFRGQAIASEKLGDFGVIEADLIREAAIREQGALAVNGGFEVLGGFVIFDGDAVEV